MAMADYRLCDVCGNKVFYDAFLNDAVPENWPWSKAWWKPYGPRRDLIRAGALIVAEIERRDRLDARGNSAFKFSVGELVRKPSGYAFDGIVRSAFMVSGGDRYVVESEASPGLLHIFNGSQLERKS